ncbi:hypothetical protein ALC62_04087 [Cyphomyrmex costatus]|uniref:DUF4817 domain-containing protein n=1 Tax=Cyphomyrmex costatus TaxID=456900 RepID=A0A151IKL7_9HYME|nr:hypothetical protein ALC62_04087 [Cyphomyrmex costatus]
MANYTPTEVVDILITFGECGRNYRLTARTYAERFPNRRHPTDQQIINIERRSRNNPLISTSFTKGYKNIDYFCKRIICHFTRILSEYKC